jgi:2-iminobutanoate/2-iminopropanoate deaminase
MRGTLDRKADVMAGRSARGNGNGGDDIRRVALRAAVAAIVQHGFENVRLRDVADIAGVSVGALQHHFGHRDTLLQEAFGAECQGILDDAAALAEDAGHPWVRIVALVDRVVLSPGHDHVITWLEFCTSATRRPDMQRTLHEVYASWRSVLLAAVKDGVSSGVFHPALPVDEVVDLISLQFDGMEMAIANDVPGFDPRRARALFLRAAAALLGGLETLGEIPAPPVRAVNPVRLSSAVEGSGSTLVTAPGAPWTEAMEYSQTTRTGDLVFASGQGGFDDEGQLVPGGFEAQLRQAFANLDQVLGRQGARLDSIAKLTVYLANGDDYDTFKAVRREVFAAPYPASTAIAVARLLAPGMLVEIDAVAVAGGARRPL